MARTAAAFFLLMALSGLAPAEEMTTEGRYEDWVKGIVRSLPRPLPDGETVFDWWPLDSKAPLKYRIVHSRWDDKADQVGTEFSIEIVPASGTSDWFQFKVDGFEDFPYEGVAVDENRVNLVTRFNGAGVKSTTRETPLLAFPLFEGILIGTREYECEFLKETVLHTTEERFYAPVCTDFWTVSEVLGKAYKLSQISPRGLHLEFVRGTGITRWQIPGGLTIELVDR